MRYKRVRRGHVHGRCVRRLHVTIEIFAHAGAVPHQREQYRVTHGHHSKGDHTMGEHSVGVSGTYLVHERHDLHMTTSAYIIYG